MAVLQNKVLKLSLSFYCNQARNVNALLGREPFWLSFLARPFMLGSYLRGTKYFWWHLEEYEEGKFLLWRIGEEIPEKLRQKREGVPI